MTKREALISLESLGDGLGACAYNLYAGVTPASGEADSIKRLETYINEARKALKIVKGK